MAAPTWSGWSRTRWYETGLLTAAERRRITAEAAAVARCAAVGMVEQARSAGGKAGAQDQGGLKRIARGAAAAQAQAGKAAHGARTATGAAAGKAGARAQRTARSLREGSRKVVRRRRPAATEGAGEHDTLDQAPD